MTGFKTSNNKTMIIKASFADEPSLFVIHLSIYLKSEIICSYISGSAKSVPLHTEF